MYMFKGLKFFNKFRIWFKYKNIIYNYIMHYLPLTYVYSPRCWR